VIIKMLSMENNAIELETYSKGNVSVSSGAY
jgi:hypothetical protein